MLGSALAASLAAVWWSWRHRAFLLYGDAEAHVHIARRLFDSHRPGMTQLGSVWLPLPHLLLVPFLLDDRWWRSGFAAVVPSAACYLLACLGLYRLMRKWLSVAASAIGLALFAANPNLLYLQTTAMTEPLFLCELIWSVLLLVAWYESLHSPAGLGSPARFDGAGNASGRKLWAVVAVLVAAVYTRYDGWILACLAWAAMAVCLARRRRLLRTGFILASVVLLLAPAGWMIYNAAVFGDWLDFARGPYSARAIELRTASSSVDPHPGWHNPWVSLSYFTKAAELDAAAPGWGEWVFAIAVSGVIWAWLRAAGSHFDDFAQIQPSQSGGFITRAPQIRRSGRAWFWTLLLWLPLPFYAYSVSYGSVPIFLPVWKPFSWYNTRYGMELLPALAFFFAFATEFALAWLAMRRPGYRQAAIAALILLLAANFPLMLREPPLTYMEAKKNAGSRAEYSATIAAALMRLHALDPGGIVLIDTSTFPGIVPAAGLTYRQTVNESDREFYWAALGAPAAHAAIVVAFAGDEIDKAVHAHPEHLKRYLSFRAPGKGWDQLDATVYVTDTFPASTPDRSSTLPARQ